MEFTLPASFSLTFRLVPSKKPRKKYERHAPKRAYKHSAEFLAKQKAKKTQAQSPGVNPIGA